MRSISTEKIVPITDTEVANQASDLMKNKITASDQLIEDLENFCKVILDKEILGSRHNLESDYAKLFISEAELYAYDLYKKSLDKVEQISPDRQSEILSSILKSKPEFVKALLQSTGKYLDESVIKSLRDDPEYFLIILGGNEDFTKNQKGRISLRINPEYYKEAFFILCELKKQFPAEILHSKIILPSAVGSGTEDAVIYLHDMSISDEISRQVESVTRQSEYRIFFMDELDASGIYKAELPQSAYSVDEDGSAGGLGMFFSKLAVKAARLSLTEAITSREAVEKILDKAGFELIK